MLVWRNISPLDCFFIMNNLLGSMRTLRFLVQTDVCHLSKITYSNFNLRQINHICWCGGMADATDSKSVGGNTMWVRLPPPAPPAQALGDLSLEKVIFLFVLFTFHSSFFTFHYSGFVSE